MAIYKLTIDFNKEISVNHSADVSNEDNNENEEEKKEEVFDQEFFDKQNDFSNCNFGTKDLSKLDLSNKTFINCSFHQTVLTEAKLNNTVMTYANLSEANLQNASLENAKMENANLHEAQLGKAKLNNVYLVGADLQKADLTGTVLAGANLTGANLKGCSGMPDLGDKEKCTVIANGQQLVLNEELLDTAYTNGTLQQDQTFQLNFEYAPYSTWDKTKKWTDNRPNPVSNDFYINSDTLCNCDLVSIKYQKEMYAHNWVEFILLFKIPQKAEKTAADTWMNDLLRLFKRARVKLSAHGGSSSPSTIAESYAVFQMQVERKKSSDNLAYIKFRAFSPDKFLSIQKYCKAYIGKHLFKDIITKELTSDLQNAHFSWKDHFSNHFQTLKVTEKNEEEDLLQPYLVQYNEDLYNFLVRTLNRCGEFLYYEDDQLNFGCPNAYVKKIEDNQVIDINSYISYHQKVFNDFYNDNYDIFECDYTKRPGENKLTHVLNTELGVVEHLEHIPRGGYTAWYDFKPWAQNILWALEGMLDKRDVADMIYYLIDFWGLQLATATINSNKKNKLIEDTHFIDDNLSEEKKEEALGKLANGDTYDDRHGTVVKDKKNVEVVKLYSNLDASCVRFNKSGQNVTFFTPKFYDLIKRGIQRSEQGRIQIRLGANFYPLKLGSLIKIQDNRYLVVKIEGNCFSRYLDEEQSVKFKNDIGFSNTKEEDPTYDPYKTRRGLAYQETSLFRHIEEDCIIEAIPFQEDALTFPTDSQRPNVINSGAQRAYITDNMDPMRMNRVRFRYAWQTDQEKGSPWVRLSTPMATTAGGINMLPVIGDEAIVNYEYGNIERPYIQGMVHNKTHPPRLSHMWDASRSISSANGHTINFDDNPLSGQAFLSSFAPAFGTVTSLLPWKMKWSLDSKPPLKAGGISMNDGWGMYKFVMSADKRMIMIDSPLGAVTLHAFTGINIMAPNGNIKIFGKNVDIIAGNKLNLSSGANMKSFFAHDIYREGEQIEGIVKNIFGQKLAPVDMTFVRTLWEALIRPVAGTLNIKAPRYLIMETGKGEAKIPNRRWMAKHGKRAYASKANSKQSALNSLKLFSKSIVVGLPECKAIMESMIAERNNKINALNNELKTYKRYYDKINNRKFKKRYKGTDNAIEAIEYTTLLKDFIKEQEFKNIKFKTDDFDKIKTKVNEGYYSWDITEKKGETSEKHAEKQHDHNDIRHVRHLIHSAETIQALFDEEDTLLSWSEDNRRKFIEKHLPSVENVADNQKQVNTLIRKFLDQNSGFYEGINKYFNALKNLGSFKWENAETDKKNLILTEKGVYHLTFLCVVTASKQCSEYLDIPEIKSYDSKGFKEWVKDFKAKNAVSEVIPEPDKSSFKEYVKGKLDKYLITKKEDFTTENIGKRISAIGTSMKNTYGWAGVGEDKIWHFTTPNTIMFSNAKGTTFSIAEDGQIKELKDDPFFDDLIKFLENIHAGDDGKVTFPDPN